MRSQLKPNPAAPPFATIIVGAIRETACTARLLRIEKITKRTQEMKKRKKLYAGEPKKQTQEPEPNRSRQHPLLIVKSRYPGSKKWADLIAKRQVSSSRSMSGQTRAQRILPHFGDLWPILRGVP